MTADACVHRPEWEGAFDLVLVDAPCSGLGVIRKKPDIRYKDPEPLQPFLAYSSRILENVSSYVRPGGTLLYSTCTLLRRENEDVVSAFLEAHPQFGPEPFQLPGVPGTEGSSWMLTLWPHIQGTGRLLYQPHEKEGGSPLIDLKSMTPEELAAWFREQGNPPSGPGRCFSGSIEEPSPLTK